MNFLERIEYEWALLKRTIPEEKENIVKLEYNESADNLISYLVAGEDHRYRYHPGFDPIAITRAIVKNIFYHRREGASTIEQQLVRVLIEDYRFTFGRKVKEILLAAKIKRLINKREAALIYLNVAYYGTKYSTFDSLLWSFHLNKESEFTDRICAEIVARLKYPEPEVCSERIQRLLENRVRYILAIHDRYEKSKLLKLWE